MLGMNKEELKGEDLDLIYDLVSAQLDQTMRGDWLAVRSEASKLHYLLARLIRLQIKQSTDS